MIASIATAALGTLGTLGTGASGQTTVPAAEEVFHRPGTGMTTEVGIGDVDGDGQGEAFLGGRGIGRISESSLHTGRFGWTNKWLGSTEPVGDDDTAQQLEVVDLDGDGAEEVLVGSDSGLWAVDAKTGATKWYAADPPAQAPANGAWEIAVADFDDDGGLDVAFSDLIDDGVTFVNGEDGTALATYARPEAVALDMDAADLDGDGVSELVVIGQAFDATESNEVHAITWGLVGPQALWKQQYPAVGGDLPPLPVLGGEPGDAVAVMIADVTAGAGPSVIVGGAGVLNVLNGETGAAVGQGTVPANWVIHDLEPAQLDGDAEQEIVAAVNYPHHLDPNGAVHAFDGNATPLWTIGGEGETPDRILDWVYDLESANVDADPALETIVADGHTLPEGRDETDGDVMAIESNGVQPSIVWSTPVPENASSIAVGDVFGQPSILVSQEMPFGEGGGVVALAMSGTERWRFRTNGRVEQVFSADVDGDGDPELIEGSSDSFVGVHDADGPVIWQRRVPGKASPDVKGVAAGEISGDHPGLEVLAGTHQFYEEFAGRLLAYDAMGEELWRADISTPNEPGSACAEELVTISGAAEEIRVEDVDGDGANDVVVGAASTKFIDPCGVIARYTGHGHRVWSRAVSVGNTLSLDTWDVDDDGTRDVLVGRNSFSGGGAVYAFDGETGAELWRYEGTVEEPMGPIGWVDAGPEGVAAAAHAGDVVLLDHAGEETWRVTYETHINGIDWSGSWDGQWSIDADDDGVTDLLTGHTDDATRMLSGVDGSEIWKTPTGGPFAFQVSTLRGGERPIAAVGLAFGLEIRDEWPGWIDLLDARTGELLKANHTAHPILDLRADDVDGDGVEEVLGAAGWRLTALTSGEEPQVEVDPTATPTIDPTATPTADPTVEPTATPTAEATATPTSEPAAPLNPAASPSQTAAMDPGRGAARRRIAPVGLFARATRTRRGVTIRGHLLPPLTSGYRACTGTVTANRRTSRVRRDCYFRLRLRGAGRRVTVRFAGNRFLKPARARIRVPRRGNT